MTRERLTPSTISANLSYLAGLSEQELADNNTHELRKLLKGCGVTQVECLTERTSKGVVVRVGDDIRRADANKDECLKAIADITKDRKLVASATGFDSTVIVRLEELPEKAWLLRAIVDEQTPTYDIAKELNDRIKVEYPEAHQFGTRTVIRSKYVGILKSRLQARGLFKDSIRDRFTGFRSHLIDIGKPESDAMNARIKDRRIARKAQNRSLQTYVEFNCKPLVDWSERILTKLPASSRQWREVALALAVVSGRRCTSELLCTQTSAELVDARNLKWSGLAKDRDNSNKPESMVAPTLVDAQLVIDGMKWLGSMDKREQERDRAHARFSSDLTKKWREIAKALNLPVFESLPEKEQNELHKVHGARKLYTNIVLLRENLIEGGEAHVDVINERAREILGHEKEETSAFYRLPMTLTEA